MSWTKYAGKVIWLEEEMGKSGMAEELVQYMSFCCAVKKKKEETVTGKLVAVNFYLELWVGLPLPVSRVSVKAVTQGIKRAHVESGSQQRVRRPLTWGMLAEMEGGSYEWGVGGRVMCIELALTYLLLLRASEFAEENGVFHKVYSLRFPGRG